MTARLMVWFLLLCFTPAIVLPVQQSPAIDDAAIKLKARWVNLNVSVTDPQGRKVTRLKPEDFVILEDGVRQEIVHFAPVDAPVNLVLLMDLSGSIGDKLKEMKKAANRFVDSLKENDRVAIAVFTSRFKLVSDFTSDRKLLHERLDHLKHPGGGTKFYDAAWSAFDLLDQLKDTRKAIVMLTDGVDNAFRPEDEEGSTHSFDEMLMRAVEADTTIYPIYFDTEQKYIRHYGRAAYATARKQLQALAEETGGAYFSAARIEDLNGVYQQVTAELHSLYTVAYAAKDTRKDGRWRAIKLQVNLAGIKTKTKRGYYAK